MWRQTSRCGLVRPNQASFSGRLYATASPKQTVGFIGLGNMGGHMANNLMKSGLPLVVFDLDAKVTRKFEENGARIARHPREVATLADRVITMLPSSPHVERVYCDPKEGLMGDNGEGSRQGNLLIDASTIDPSVARKVHEFAKKRGVHMIDAPVSGGVGGAEKGTLTFMVGGSDEAFQLAKPLLERMGKNLVHCGQSGCGQAAKLCNNLVLGVSMAGVSEGMLLGQRLGLDPKLLAGIFNSSTARCWSSELYNPVPGVVETAPASRGYTGGFGAALMSKDLGLAVDAARDAGCAELPLANRVDELYRELKEKGEGHRDFSVVFDYLDRVNKKKN